MKWTRRYKVCFLTIIAGAAFAMTGLSLPQEARPALDKATLPLVPVFSTAQDGPEFTLDYVNDTNDGVGTIDLLQGSSVTLDGKVYPRGFVGGSLVIAPGQTISVTIDLSQYLPGARLKKMGYSKTLERWRWKPLLKSGKHTLLVTVGEQQYGPITFIWRGDVPLLYE